MSRSIEINNSIEVRFITDDSTPSGINKIAGKVAKDTELVTDCRTSQKTIAMGDSDQLADMVDGQSENTISVIYGIAGESENFDTFAGDSGVNISQLSGKREVYLFCPLAEKRVILIAGSDKRGTIYGLFHLSQLLGVSPLVNWSNVVPEEEDIFPIRKSFLCFKGTLCKIQGLLYK